MTPTAPDPPLDPPQDPSRPGDARPLDETEQLRAAFQELQASHEQLRATEQRLRATNDRLQATERRLRVSEKRFRQLVEKMPVGVARVSLDHRIEQVNAAYCEMLGYDERELIGRHLDEITHPETLEENLAQQARLVRGEIDHYRLEKIFVPKGGGVVVGLLDANLVRDAAGEPSYCIGAVLDITERKRAERALHAEEEKYRLLADNTSDIIWTLGMDLRFRYVNPAITDITGYTPEDLVGTELRSYCEKEAFDGFQELFHAALARGPGVASEVFETNLRRKEGGWVPVEVHARLLFDEDGKPTLIQGVSRDITERRALHARMAQADRLSSMGMLAAGVAHELNSPLTYLLHNLESLEEELPPLFEWAREVQGRLGSPEAPTSKGSPEPDLPPCPADGEDLWERFGSALEGARQIRDITHVLGSFSRVERHELEPVDIREAMDAALDMASNEIKFRARLDRSYRPVPPVMATKGRLSQVFLNLVINATHAIEEGAVKRNVVRVRTWQEGSQVCAEVRDTGCGIAPEHLDRLFDPFFTTKAFGEGTGLGLSISQSIIEGYGGDIAVRSEPGKGTCVTIRLPASSPATSTDAPPKTSKKAERPLSGRILVVDDERRIRNILVRMLRNHTTVVTASGEEARDLLERDQDFHVILCDMMMPGLSGMDLHRWLVQAHPELARNLIFITGGAFTPRTREYLVGVDNPQLEKPFDPSRLRELVDARCRRAGG